MKMLNYLMPLLPMAVILSLNSCKTEDPSAMDEIQRDLAQAIAKSKKLEQEVASLTEQLDQAHKSSAKAESMKMPTAAEIEQSLAIEGTKLQQIARSQHPDSKIASFEFFDLDIPSFDTPFSCNAKVELIDPSGVLETLYWSGYANMKGEWKFEEAEHIESHLTKNDTSPVIQPEPDNKKDSSFDMTLEKPIDGHSDINKQEPNPKPPELPETKYDIRFDNPLMGPKGR
jgi:hypothetical protein